MPRPIPVLVTSATERQGRAIAHLLLEKGHEVRALTSRPGCTHARDLRALGADVAVGGLEDKAAIRRAAEGMRALVLIGNSPEEDTQAEIEQGCQAAEAARDAGVRHVVYASVAGAGRSTLIPHFDSKRRVEIFIQGMGVPHTIVAPVYLMENFLDEAFLEGLRANTLSMPLPESREVQVTSAVDVAQFVRMVVERPTEFQAKRIEIASDALSGLEAASVLAHVTGRAICFARSRPQGEGSVRMWEWVDRVGYDVDIDRLRQTYPDLGWHSFGAWATEQDWTLLHLASSKPQKA
ncbi:MAG TPA: NmrA family NAD(P)-binding protein [Anaeromyxobacteraceae bacterium]|nr:NmrA family NAD(P)-binding protein [Anaeromyxobacteraceae bacterium]